MGKLLVEVEDEVLEKLERVAPDRQGRRSEFVSLALRKAFWELEEQKTAKAYADQPDSAEEAYFDPEVWEL